MAPLLIIRDYVAPPNVLPDRLYNVSSNELKVLHGRIIRMVNRAKRVIDFNETIWMQTRNLWYVWVGISF